MFSSRVSSPSTARQRQYSSRYQASLPTDTSRREVSPLPAVRQALRERTEHCGDELGAVHLLGSHQREQPLTVEQPLARAQHQPCARAQRPHEVGRKTSNEKLAICRWQLSRSSRYACSHMRSELSQFPCVTMAPWAGPSSPRYRCSRRGDPVHPAARPVSPVDARLAHRRPRKRPRAACSGVPASTGSRCSMRWVVTTPPTCAWSSM